MTDKKRKRPPYKHGQEIRAILSKEGIAKRNEIKLKIASLSGTAVGRVSDSVIFEKALDLYHEMLIKKKKNVLPDGLEVMKGE